MTRETRMLLVVGLLSVVGVTSLALIADRYRRLLAEDPEPHNRFESRTIDLPPPVPTVDEAVARFAIVRGAVREIVVENEDAIRTARDAETGALRPDVAARLLNEIRASKRSLLDRLGMTEREYEQIRDAYHRWRSGQGDLEAAFLESFEKRRDRLESLDLGDLESLDLPIDLR